MQTSQNKVAESCVKISTSNCSVKEQHAELLKKKSNLGSVTDEKKIHKNYASTQEKI